MISACESDAVWGESPVSDRNHRRTQSGEGWRDGENRRSCCCTILKLDVALGRAGQWTCVLSRASVTQHHSLELGKEACTYVTVDVTTGGTNEVVAVTMYLRSVSTATEIVLVIVLRSIRLVQGSVFQSCLTQL